jgi:hypothetical protein
MALSARWKNIKILVGFSSFLLDKSSKWKLVVRKTNDTIGILLAKLLRWNWHAIFLQNKNLIFWHGFWLKQSPRPECTAMAAPVLTATESELEQGKKKTMTN